jgi:hypothetical protein
MQGTMDYPNLTSFIKSEGSGLSKGPIALLFALNRHIKLGFKQIIVFAKSLTEIDDDTLTQVTTVYVTHSRMIMLSVR